MNKIDNQSTLPNYLGHKRKAEEMKNAAIKQHIPSDSFDKLALSNRTSMSMKIVFQSVSSQISAKFEKFNHSSNDRSSISPHTTSSNIVPKTPLVDNESSVGFFDFEEVARTVMNFVGGSILAAQANGASDDELKEMFDQGRAGANLGIDQAMGDLKDLALLDDELALGIEKSRDLINKNIDDLYQNIFPSEKQPNSKGDIELPDIYHSTVDSELYVSNSKSSNLSITTNDGDVVTISFSELQEHASRESYQYEEGNKGNTENYSMATSQYHEMNFSYSVEGELNDNELAAIESLIKDVNSLQKDFFSGKVDQAFEKAIELGFDNAQIANFSMDLQQTQTSFVSQTYTEVAEFQDNALPKSDKELRPLIDFLDHFKQLQDNADKLLSKNDDAFGQLLDSVFNAEYGVNEEAKDKFDKVIAIVKHLEK